MFPAHIPARTPDPETGPNETSQADEGVKLPGGAAGEKAKAEVGLNSLPRTWRTHAAPLDTGAQDRTPEPRIASTASR